jgi:hypothetical protein
MLIHLNSSFRLLYQFVLIFLNVIVKLVELNLNIYMVVTSVLAEVVSSAFPSLICNLFIIRPTVLSDTLIT